MTILNAVERGYELMADGGSIEIIARDRTSGSVLTLSADPLGEKVGTELHGIMRAQGESNGPFMHVETEISLDTEDWQVAYEERVSPAGNSVVLYDPAGNPLKAVTAYQRTETVGGRYAIVSGEVSEEGQLADLFAITDPVVETIALAVGGTCLVMYGAQIWAVKRTMDDYKAAGLVPRLSIKTSLLKFVSCNFDVKIDPYDPRTGSSLPSVHFHIGGRKKKSKK